MFIRSESFHGVLTVDKKIRQVYKLTVELIINEFECRLHNYEKGWIDCISKNKNDYLMIVEYQPLLYDFDKQ